MTLRARLIALAVFAPSVFAADAAASQTVDTAQRRVTIQGDAPSVCKMDAPQSAGGANVQFSAVSDSAGALQFQALADPTTAQAQASQVSVTFPVVCTGAHSVSVASANGGLTNGSPTTPGFATRVDYALSAQWAGQQGQFQTAGSPASLNLTQSDAAAGNLTVAIRVGGGGLPLVAGAYSDQVVVQFNATP